MAIVVVVVVEVETVKKTVSNHRDSTALAVQPDAGVCLTIWASVARWIGFVDNW